MQHARAFRRLPVLLLILLLPGFQAWGQEVDRLAASRFLEQAAFGPTARDVERVQALGYSGWLDEQMQLPATEITDTGRNVNALMAGVLTRMTKAPDQLRQKVAYVLYRVLVISRNKNLYVEEIRPHLQTLDRHAFGNYRDLLREVAQSGAMGLYLDLAGSCREQAGRQPNENFARELLQLFSIGTVELNIDGSEVLDAQGNPVPTYTQNDIREFSRALTGWRWVTEEGRFIGNHTPLPMATQPSCHDTGRKNLLGYVVNPNRTAEQEMDEVIDVVFRHKNTAPFLATRFIRYLVKSNPSPQYIARVARVFENDGRGVRGNLAAVTRAVLLDPEAREASVGATGGRLKDWQEYLVCFLRTFESDTLLNEATAAITLFSTAGHMVITPPSVFSWYTPYFRVPDRKELYGPEFQTYSPAATVLRANILYDMMWNNSGRVNNDMGPFIQMARDPEQLVGDLNERMLYGRMPAQMRSAIVRAARSISDLRQRTVTTIQLVALSGQYGVQY